MMDNARPHAHDAMLITSGLLTRSLVHDSFHALSPMHFIISDALLTIERSKYRETEDLIDIANSLRDANKQLRRLSNQLRIFNRIMMQEKNDETSLKKLVGDFLSDFIPEYSRGRCKIELTKECEIDIKFVDSEKIKILILNIVLNPVLYFLDMYHTIRLSINNDGDIFISSDSNTFKTYALSMLSDNMQSGLIYQNSSNWIVMNMIKDLDAIVAVEEHNNTTELIIRLP